MASIAPPGSSPADAQRQVLVSSAVQTTVNVSFSIGPNLTWDGYWRLVYDRVTEGVQRQANVLLARGNVSVAEARELVESQRNVLVKQLRNRLSPFGRLYSEIVKPSTSLPTLESLVGQKGSLEAVLRSVGKARQVVDRIGAVLRVGGSALVVVQVTMTAIVIADAPQEERGRVAAREVGGVVGAASFGAGGMWAGCLAASTLVAPSLVVPVVGEITTGGACIVGGIVGGLGLGWIGSNLGKQAGENVHGFVTDVTWTKP